MSEGFHFKMVAKAPQMNQDIPSFVGAPVGMDYSRTPGFLNTAAATNETVGSRLNLTTSERTPATSTVAASVQTNLAVAHQTQGDSTEKSIEPVNPLSEFHRISITIDEQIWIHRQGESKLLCWIPKHDGESHIQEKKYNIDIEAATRSSEIGQFLTPSARLQLDNTASSTDASRTNEMKDIIRKISQVIARNNGLPEDQFVKYTESGQDVSWGFDADAATAVCTKFTWEEAALIGGNYTAVGVNISEKQQEHSAKMKFITHANGKNQHKYQIVCAPRFSQITQSDMLKNTGDLLLPCALEAASADPFLMNSSVKQARTHPNEPKADNCTAVILHSFMMLWALNNFSFIFEEYLQKINKKGDKTTDEAALLNNATDLARTFAELESDPKIWTGDVIGRTLCALRTCCSVIFQTPRSKAFGMELMDKKYPALYIPTSLFDVITAAYDTQLDATQRLNTGDTLYFSADAWQVGNVHEEETNPLKPMVSLTMTIQSFVPKIGYAYIQTAYKK